MDWDKRFDRSKKRPARQGFGLCVLAAGVFGALTASRKILFIQAVPAAIGLLLVLAAG